MRDLVFEIERRRRVQRAVLVPHLEPRRLARLGRRGRGRSSAARAACAGRPSRPRPGIANAPAATPGAVTRRTGLGSGFFVDGAGHIVTTAREELSQSRAQVETEWVGMADIRKRMLAGEVADGARHARQLLGPDHDQRDHSDQQKLGKGYIEHAGLEPGD